MTDFLPRLSAALADRYRLERELGAGGMAIVHLAHDLRHDRKVALKVLRPELAAVIGAERFLREIKTTANLQHPHILALIDSGETDGLLWYVMPFVEGESLRDLIKREKQLPVNDAVRLATEVASALDYAHRHDVIHRDIKPENILLNDGRALVADFGIALAASAAGGTRMTGTGMSLGTPNYMSPEQAMGEREITARSDVYALGCVLYEMLCGEAPFTGPTAQAIIAQVMTEEPRSPRMLRKTIPAHVEAAILQALEKLPADRFGSAAEFAAALGNPSFTSSAAARVSPVRRRARAATLLPWALLLTVVGFIAFNQLRPKPVPAPPAVYRFNFALSENAAWVDDILSTPALSPDGTLLVYNGRDSTAHRWLYLRAMDRLDPVRIPGSENGSAPFFSPDGRWIGFLLGTRIVKTPVAGGSIETVCDPGRLIRATWLESNVVVFTDGTGLRQCSMAGQLTTLLASDAGATFYQPHGLPGDRGVLFYIQRGSTNHLAVLDLRTKSVKLLDILGTDPRYVATGHLVYVSPDGLVAAVPFNAATLAVTGQLAIIDAGVSIKLGGAIMALSRTGTIIVPGGASSQRALELVDRTGRAEPLYPRLGAFEDPRFSPDGRRVALREGANIWLLDRAQGALTRLTFDGSASRPAWTPDGRHIAYVRENGAMVDLRLMKADGSAPAESLLALPDLEPYEALFTPDGRSLVVRTVGGPGRRDIWLVAVDAARRPMPLLQSSADEVSPAVSPDGRWLAHVSNESGRAEVYVRSFPGMGARYQVSLDGGTEPVWSPRGGELFYRSGPVLLAAAVRAGSTFEVLRRSPLFSNGDYAVDLTHQVYDVTPDGRHFVMVRNIGGMSQLTVTLHLFQNLGAGSSGGSATARAR